ncbi:MAG: DegT/DnrJ/EryC1/StrS family aminotransferase [Bacteroidetes bacterium]|nr:DegT/DnrJ/EryC1/StrS family aminotransferase [Bacteroidota bacterium]
MNIPFVDLKVQYNSIKESIDSAIQNVLNETSFVGGKYVKNFEEQFAKLYGVKHVIGCGNGTDTLYILMKMLGIGSGDEVITVANSWISSSETITQTGARPVFADIDPDYYSINEHLIEGLITPHTKAIVLVHLHGQMANVEFVEKLCKDKGIYLIEDCAQSHFSEQNGIRAGLRGIAGSFSFYPGKNLGAYGDAGCIMTNDNDLAIKCRMYANHGSLKKNVHIIEGINSRLDSMQASILSAKLPHILKWTEQRINNAALYNKYLSAIQQIVLPAVRPGTKHTYHLYVIRAQQRNELAKYLADNGIETSLHYPKILPNQEAYKYLNTKPEDFPVANKYQEEILSLPMYPELSEEAIQYIAQRIAEFYKS